MSGKVIDMLSDLLRGGETEATPEEQAKALEARAASYIAEAERIRKQDAAPGLALVADEPAVTSDQDEGPQSTAP
jgi:hypothetical protein